LTLRSAGGKELAHLSDFGAVCDGIVEVKDVVNRRYRIFVSETKHGYVSSLDALVTSGLPDLKNHPALPRSSHNGVWCGIDIAAVGATREACLDGALVQLNALLED